MEKPVTEPVTLSAGAISPLTLALTAFFGLMLFANGLLVYFSSQGRRDLVRSDYYDASLHEDRNMALRSAGDSLGVIVEIHKKGNGWLVAMHSLRALPAPAVTGTIRFRHPFDSRLDTEAPIRALADTTKGTWQWQAYLPGPALSSSHWKVTAELASGNLSFLVPVAMHATKG